MSKFVKNQNGFTIVEGVIILVIMALLGTISLYAWQRIHHTNQAKTQPRLTQAKTVSVTNPTLVKISANLTNLQPLTSGLTHNEFSSNTELTSLTIADKTYSVRFQYTPKFYFVFHNVKESDLQAILINNGLKLVSKDSSSNESHYESSDSRCRQFPDADSENVECITHDFYETMLKNTTEAAAVLMQAKPIWSTITPPKQLDATYYETSDGSLQAPEIDVGVGPDGISENEVASFPPEYLINTGSGWQVKTFEKHPSCSNQPANFKDIFDIPADRKAFQCQ